MAEEVYMNCGLSANCDSIMTHVATKVLATVNAPYGANLSACQLAAKIVDPASADSYDASVFAFFSEVREVLQEQFIQSMGVDKLQVHSVAKLFEDKAGFPLPLAA
jgi:hypothetical protein